MLISIENVVLWHEDVRSKLQEATWHEGGYDPLRLVQKWQD